MRIHRSGFSMIELLIVIVLMGIGFSLIGPMTVDFVDKSKARNEYLQLNRWIEKQSLKHFLGTKSSSFYFNHQSIYEISENLKSTNEPQNLIITFNYLFFESQYIRFNHNGYASSRYLTVNTKTTTKKLDLIVLTGGGDVL